MNPKPEKIVILYIEDIVTNIYGVKSFLAPYHDYVVISAEDLEGALQTLKNKEVDIILLDLGLPPDRNNFQPTLDFLCETRKNSPKIPIIVYSVISNLKPNIVKTVLRCGASYLVKEDISRGEDFKDIVSTAMKGNRVYTQAVAFRFKDIFRESTGPLFSNRELQIAKLIGEGYTNNQIAEELKISPFHVRDLVSKLLRKTDSANRAEFAVWFEQNTNLF